MPLPKLEDFLKDPKHEESRNWFDGVVNAAVDKRLQKIKDEKAKKGGEDTNIFDDFFGPKE